MGSTEKNSQGVGYRGRKCFQVDLINSLINCFFFNLHRKDKFAVRYTITNEEMQGNRKYCLMVILNSDYLLHDFSYTL